MALACMFIRVGFVPALIAFLTVMHPFGDGQRQDKTRSPTGKPPHRQWLPLMPTSGCSEATGARGE